MTLYEKNLEVIKDMHNYLYTKLKDLDDKFFENDDMNIESIDAKDGNKSLIIEKDNVKYRLNSIYRPLSEAEKWVEQYDFKNLGIVISMYGFGNGIFIRSLLKKIKKDDFLLVYEPSSSVFYHVLNNYDITDILNDKVVIVVKDVNDRTMAMALEEHVSWINFNSQVTIRHPVYDKVFKDELKIFRRILKDSDEKILVYRNSEVHFGKNATLNIIYNLRYLAKNNIVIDFANKFDKDIPAIIVASGPSLDKNIDKLKDAKGKAVIIAVDTALKHLLKKDIIPDFIVTVDPNKGVFHFRDPNVKPNMELPAGIIRQDDFLGKSERVRNIPIFCKSDSNRRILQFNKKRIIFFDMHPYMQQMILNNGKIVDIYNSGGSVATAAYSICVTLGFKNIILVGQDLAYKGDLTHAGNLESSYNNDKNSQVFVEGNYEEKVKTRHDWYIYLEWFNNAVEGFKDGDIVNATEGGAKIKGTKVMTLEEAIKEYCKKEINCEDLVNEVKPTFEGSELEGIIKSIQNSVDDLDIIKRKSKESKQICEKLIKLYKRNIDETVTTQKLNKRLMKINTTLSEKPVYLLIEYYTSDMAESELKDVYQYKEVDEEEKLKTYKMLIKVYNSVLETVDKLKEEFDNTLDYLNKKE